MRKASIHKILRQTIYPERHEAAKSFEFAASEISRLQRRGGLFLFIAGFVIGFLLAYIIL